ncbi:MAG: lysine--tRNA ligase, partial [Gammaproteobacteria bacterium]|nr:lysine--tRNA ligase [Gammaproteobacteria bacterium]
MKDQEDNKLVAERKSKLALLRAAGIAFANDFKPEHLAVDILAEFGQHSKEVLDEMGILVSIAGRMMHKRVMGKASFPHIQDVSRQIQLFVTRDELPENFYNEQF